MICLLNNNNKVQYFENSPKRTRFMELGLKQYCHNTRHKKLRGLCKTRCVERHSCLETFGELHEHVVTCLDAMVNPHMFIQSLTQFVGIGIVTPRLRPMV